MATYIPYTPTNVFAKALFNFDGISGTSDYLLTGPITVSVSDSFSYDQYLLSSTTLSRDIYTSQENVGWSASQISNVNLVTSTYAKFIPLSFTSAINYSGSTPADIGIASDINISLIYRSDLNFSGFADGSSDNTFGYAYAQGDIVLNVDGFGPFGSLNNASLDPTTFGFQTLMHEIGHSLGLSHPHSAIVNGVPVITTDYIATMYTGFNKLGFVINSPMDMYREYFSIMSYDDETVPSGANIIPQTPMILDILALQSAYGEGPGTSGNGNDVITPGSNGVVSSFRTYFDTGGTDTIDLANYVGGAYLDMGESIQGANHLVGVSMSRIDQNRMALHEDPYSLRWFYGEFENAVGSSGDDWINGNELNNVITGGPGNDFIYGGGGVDTVVFSGIRANYTLTGSTVITVKDNVGTDGTDSVQAIDRLEFSDGVLALDVGNWQTAGEAYRLYRAAFARTPDNAGLKYWIAQMDNGQTDIQVAHNFIVSAEYQALYGANPTHAQEVTALYQNVLDRAPDQSGYNYWLNLLDTNQITPEQILINFSESAENVAAVSPTISGGIWMT